MAYINNPPPPPPSAPSAMPFLLTRPWLHLLPTPVTAFIDIDLCTMYGNDFNDLIWILQLMHRSRSDILVVMRKLLNPAMAMAIKRLETLGHSVRVCVYTHKGSLIDEASNRYKASNGDLYFPASTRFSKVDNRNPLPFERLFLARQVIGEALGRKDIEMVVTGRTKSVSDTCLHTLVPPANPARAFLYDDNPAYEDATVVPSFDAISMIKAEAVLRITGREPLDEKILIQVKEDMHEHYHSLSDTNSVSICFTTTPVSVWPLPSVCKKRTVSLGQHLEAATRGYVCWKIW